ncbi:MAG: AbrB/MazE/SpoVT family DNA-binding domain-containing protein [Oscillospiraceae bacterium]|nr:AbrB/MazE/SpoVT family DNA-binding domain-containing protein [Oscillospiraceae bacterium]
MDIQNENRMEVRSVDEVARVIIPRSLCTKYGISEGDEIAFSDEGSFIGLRKHRSSCCICGSLEDLILIGEARKSICRGCASEIKSA